MALTSKLGTADSLLGNIQLAGGASITNNQAPSNSLNLSQTVTLNKVLNLSVGNTLTLTDTERAFQSKKFASNTIVLDQDSVVNFVFSRAPASTITFVGLAFAERVQTAANTIVFSQMVVVEKFKWTTSTFSILQDLSYSQIHNERPLQNLLFSQTVVGAMVRKFTPDDTITFDQDVVVKRVRSFAFAHTLYYNQTVANVTILGPSNTLALSQTLTYQKIMHFALTSTIAFVQTLNVNTVLNLSVSNQLVYGTATQRPGISNVPITVPPVLVTTVRPQVIFQTGTRVLALKQPEFGDGEAGTSSVITHRTVTGVIFTYARRSLARKLSYKFLVGRPKAEETRLFIRESLSTPMYMTNWKGELWYGHIVNNPFGLTPQRRRMPCDGEEIELDVEFEGVRVH